MIQIDNLNVKLPGFALREINISIKQGEFFILLGPTGAGKTVVLESAIGIIPIAKGCITINGKDVTQLPPEKRDMGIVYQDFALFPHLTVYNNITYGLRYRRINGKKPGKNLSFIIKRLSLEPLLQRSVLNLSGGEKQRVALARALAVDPSVLLLDEPLSALDPNFREDIREILKKLHVETGITVLMVTHDFTEAHFLAQRTAVINNGRIEQTGSIAEVFYQPSTPFVAEFVGMKNIFPAIFNGDTAKINSLTIHTNEDNNVSKQYVAIRPEHIRISKNKESVNRCNLFEGTVSKILNQGFYCDVSIKTKGIKFASIIPTNLMLNLNLEKGQKVNMWFNPVDVHVF
ncbi:MAG: ABC transporter ATP-binding protein [Deltaproteobacteria bacterium]|nr:ABC transporter ATP-binding protein [Deltaproteobacteria bacterium]